MGLQTQTLFLHSFRHNPRIPRKLLHLHLESARRQYRMSVKGRIYTRKEKLLGFLCSLTTVAFLGFGFLFPNALPRLAETLRDLLFSTGYYLYGIIGNGENPVFPSVTEFASWQFAESPWKPIMLFPFTWEEFKLLVGTFWRLLFNKSNFRIYF